MRHKILLGLTGSVATVLYKKLIAGLQMIGDVEVVLTESSKHFLYEKDILDMLDMGNEALWMDKDEWEWMDDPIIDTWRDHYEKDDPVLHINLRDRCSALVIAPCSANTMGKLANGLCDNLLTSVVRAWDSNRPVIIAPAMNTHMWNHPLTGKHLKTLVDLGYDVVRPQDKMLACGTKGIGALANIEDIVYAAEYALRWNFPVSFDNCSGVPVGNHPGAFAVQRKHEQHTGVDLYVPEGELVRVVEAGTVVGIEHFTGEWDNSPWWNNTDCILVEGATGVICYGEIAVNPALKVGMRLKRGCGVGRVARVLKEKKERPDIPGHKTSMLHMEVYPHGVYRASHGFEDINNDPTPFLLNCIERTQVKQLTYDKKDKHACVVHAPRADDLQEGFTPQ